MLAGVGLEEPDVGDDRVVQLDRDVILRAQLPFRDTEQLWQRNRGAAGRRGIGERGAVETGAECGREIAGERIGGIEPDVERIARTCARRLRQKAGLLFRLADRFELGRAFVDLGLRVGIVIRLLHRVRLDGLLRARPDSGQGEKDGEKAAQSVSSVE